MLFTSIAQTQPSEKAATVPAPALTIQNLPASQRKFRVDALMAVNEEIRRGAAAAVDTYSSDVLKNWKRVEVNRSQTLFGDSVSVVLLRIDSNKKIVEIAVRGTVNLNDALHNLNAKADLDTELGFGIHSGFRILALEILVHLKKNELSDEVLRNYEFKLYGHSLGGAIASILSMYLHQSGSNVTSVITFGAPRFTTNEGARKYQVLNQVTHRVVRCDDVVPFLPPPNFFGWTNQSYQANGNIFLMLSPPYFDYSVGIDIERDFINQLRLELANKGATNTLAYGHRMKNYDDLLLGFTPTGMMLKSKRDPFTGLQEVSALMPVSYTLKLQPQLCPLEVGWLATK